MVRRALFLSAAIFCGSVSFANASIADVTSACQSGSCEAAAAQEAASYNGLSEAEKTAALDALVAALAALQGVPSSQVAAAINAVASSYSTAADRTRVASIASAVSNQARDVNTAALGGPADGPNGGSEN